MRWTFGFFIRLVLELSHDLWDYYVTPYPILLIWGLLEAFAAGLISVFDATGIQIFIFAILEVPSRRLILIDSTANPTKDWILQQFRNCCISGHEFPRAMVQGRDGISGKWLPNILQELGL